MKYNTKKVLVTVTCILIFFLLLSIIPIKFYTARHRQLEPQAIFTLGGWTDREEFTARFARKHPDLDIWISTGMQREITYNIFTQETVSLSRLHLDFRAVDTVTNFTTLIPKFKARGIRHLYLITSDYHLPRAKKIAFLILGSQGIAFTPVSVPSEMPPEKTWDTVRDCIRALYWIVAGYRETS